MIYRHNIDKKVFNFVTEKLNKKMGDSNSYIYEHFGKDIKIEINKREVARLENKISIHIFEVDNTKQEKVSFMNKPFSKKFSYTLSIEFSNKLREFIEKKQDESNQDFIRNSTDELSNFIDNLYDE